MWHVPPLRRPITRAGEAAIAMAIHIGTQNVPSELVAYAARLMGNKNCKNY
jgi:hypothetical protein